MGPAVGEGLVDESRLLPVVIHVELGMKRIGVTVRLASTQGPQAKLARVGQRQSPEGAVHGHAGKGDRLARLE